MEGIRTAIVLAGGLGTRLRSAVPDYPKVLAPVAGQPFLAHLLTLLEQNAFKGAILAVGYRHEDITTTFGDQFGRLKLTYSIEDKPLGTGGAVWRAAKQLKTAQNFFVLNGDTYVSFDAGKMEEALIGKEADMVLAAHKMEDTGRYGLIDIDDAGTVKGFHEKRPGRTGMINAGVYLIRHDLPQRFLLSEAFSFETDFLSPNCGAIRMAAVPTNGYFIDIGIPEDYERATRELKKLKR